MSGSRDCAGPAGKGDDGGDQKAKRKPKAETDRYWRGRISQNAVALFPLGVAQPRLSAGDRRVA